MHFCLPAPATLPPWHGLAVSQKLIPAISKQQAADEKRCSKVHIQLELFPHEIPI